MKHIIKTEYADENTVTIAAVAVDVPDVIWLQVANPDNEMEAADRDEWTHSCGEPVMDSDVAYVPRARAEAAEGELESALAVVDLYQNRMFEAETRVTELEAQLVRFSGNHPSMELVAELLDDLKKAETTLAAALARAEAAEAETIETLENILLALDVDPNDIDEIYMEQTAKSVIDAISARVTELEAELAANGGEWRPVTEKPAHGQEVKVLAILNGVYWDDDGIFDVYQVPDEITIKGWRPAPPQE